MSEAQVKEFANILDLTLTKILALINQNSCILEGILGSENANLTIVKALSNEVRLLTEKYGKLKERIKKLEVTKG